MRTGILNCAIHTTKEGILYIRLSCTGDVAWANKRVRELIPGLSIKVSGPNPRGKDLARQIQGYLCGSSADFDDYPLVWHGITPFQRNVLACLKYVPYGKTISYKELAIRAGCPGGARAVGQALKKNPWPILFPCHRVIGKDRDLRGFSSGIIWKRILLVIEGSIREADV